MPYKPADFRLTVVKPYYIDESSSYNNNYDITITIETRTENGNKGGTITIKPTTIENNEGNDDIEQATKPVKKRGRRRPRKYAINTSTKENTAYIIIKK